MLAPSHLDSKLAALAAYGAVNPRPEAVTDPLFATSAFLDARDLVQTRYEMVRRVQVEGHAASHVAAAFGVSRQTVYQARAAFEAAGLPGLLPRPRGPRRRHKLRPEVVAFLVQARRGPGSIPVPALCQRVRERFGITVHRRSIERILAGTVKKGVELTT
ncbi:MAG: helix-turn-helix domain-containing protein [Chloroflexi bacterium]|nr:helix-turn-helix domain-containing protein [Chloroflexota bacterium]